MNGKPTATSGYIQHRVTDADCDAPPVSRTLDIINADLGNLLDRVRILRDRACCLADSIFGSVPCDPSGNTSKPAGIPPRAHSLHELTAEINSAITHLSAEIDRLERL